MMMHMRLLLSIHTSYWRLRYLKLCIFRSPSHPVTLSLGSGCLLHSVEIAVSVFILIILSATVLSILILLLLLQSKLIIV